jgi:DNA-binding response OmpR family regulator
VKILVLEDNERLAKLIKETLENDNFSVDVFYDGDKALDALNQGYRCFVLDINVPSMDGITLLETIRLYHKDVPVIIISSNNELEKIQQAYEIGANDYLKKPFYVYELVQKIKGFLQKYESTFIELQCGYRYDYVNRRLYSGSREEIMLAKKEILFLDLFVKDKHRIVTFGEMEEYVWQGEDTSLENMRALVKRLRKKLPKDAIKIVKEIGYTLN